jgi:hypothetical protein
VLSRFFGTFAPRRIPQNDSRSPLGLQMFSPGSRLPALLQPRDSSGQIG